jgi:leucyl/phenylalanyl-tRNA---protein transferase
VIPGEIRLTRSLLKTLRSGRFEVRCDTAFREVISACAGPRAYAQGTWILPEMVEAYCRMHELGWAHSVETWHDGELVGGLYGMALGKVFFGESMFHRATDASKVAFAHLARALERENFSVIDCQMTTSHLASLGGREISRQSLLETVRRELGNARPGRWRTDFVQVDWRTADT